MELTQHRAGKATAKGKRFASEVQVALKHRRGTHLDELKEEVSTSVGYASQVLCPETLSRRCLASCNLVSWSRESGDVQSNVCEQREG